MGTEILRPQDCLIERIRVPPVSRRKSNYYGSNPIPPNQNYVFNPRSRKPAARSDPRKIQVQQPAPSPMVSKRSSSDDDLQSFKMEKVTMLRRGESFDSKIGALKKERNGPVAGKTDMYAGSAFAVSPEPSSLPLPSFSTKKRVSRIVAAGDESATRDLRRLLRLD